MSNVDIEKFFFGGLDNAAPASVDYFSKFAHDSADGDSLKTLLRHMSVQKLRTPKGLAWLQGLIRVSDPNATLSALQRLQNIFAATWSDCVWQIADASASPTKFIVSDHPVTVYNRECFSGSSVCIQPGDPDIREVGTQTIFPLGVDKVLILTNLAWVRNPYQNARKMGPNETLFRGTIFNFTAIQLGRQLSEEEVIEINYIIKRRGLRYIAAAEPEWLYPEKHLRTDHWRKFGDGYLLMPEPRLIHMGGTVHAGYDNGQFDAWGPYGHKPWEPAFEDEARDRAETAALHKFHAEWSAMHGPKFRGSDWQMGGRKLKEYPDEFHRHMLEQDRKEFAKPGERARRRRLMR